MSKGRVLGLLLALFLVGPVWILATGQASLKGDWRTATRQPAGIAPSATDHPEALVHVYAARAFSWRGAFAVHTWIATKAEGANEWMVYQVTGWRMYRGLSVVTSEIDIPDRFWYGQVPEIIGELKGPQAAKAIPVIAEASARYPWPETYRLWPGPNSNTYIAWISREVPELQTRLPMTAIGKDWLGAKRLIAPSPSNTGWQFSIAGVLGLTAGRVEGLELNVLGTGLGLDVMRPAIKLPGIGRIGMAPTSR